MAMPVPLNPRWSILYDATSNGSVTGSRTKAHISTFAPAAITVRGKRTFRVRGTLASAAETSARRSSGTRVGRRRDIRSAGWSRVEPDH